MHWSQVLAEIGVEGADELDRLNRKLLPSGVLFACKDLRYSASLTTRSESELFALPLPRFAIRIKLSDGVSFVNCRRLKILHKHFPFGRISYWAVRDLTLRREERLPNVEERSLRVPVDFEDASVIADAYLVPPEDTQKRFQLVTVPLALEYGEVKSAKEDYPEATPYMKHIELFGGGSCSQAAAFMATVLMTRHARSVYGVAEISCISDIKRREICTGGMTLDSTKSYFENIGLSCKMEQCAPGLEEFSSAKPKVLATQLKAYLFSRMPIIVPVNALKMAYSPSEDQSVYGRNRYEVAKSSLNAHALNNHSIVLIGAGIANSNEILFHDPGAVPYMTCTTSDLVNISYRSDSYNALYQSITPEKVLMPLGWSRSQENQAPFPGLMDIARLYIAEQRIDRPDPLIETGDFGLSSLESLSQHPLIKTLLSGDLHLREQFDFLIVWLERQIPSRWIWFQILSDSVLLWDAEQSNVTATTDSSDMRKPAEILIAKFIKNTFYDAENKICITWSTESNPEFVLKTEKLINKNTEASFESRIKPSVSLITSFSLEPGNDQCRIPDDVDAIEMYAFMQRELPLVFDHFEAGMTAAECMKAMFNDVQASNVVVERIKSRFLNKRIIGFASFLPGISAPEDQGYLWQVTQEALMFLVQLAYAFPDCEFVELVSGNRLEGIWQGQEKLSSQYIYVAKKADFEARVKMLLRRLEPVVALSKSLAKAKGRSRPIRLAMELEPGPLYLLNEDFPCIQRLCSMIDQSSQEIQDLIGLNLDIAHWAFLGGISIEAAASDVIKKHIVHAHISDLRKGHFQDCVVASLHSPDEYAPWIKLLSSLDGSSKYSGFISCELECAKDQTYIDDSVAETRSLIQRFCVPE
jgi:hypothetical protein